MAFKSKEELGGLDPNINAKGRIAPAEPLNNRQLREQEVLNLLRKLKPHVSVAIMSAVKIMQDNKAADQNKLKAAVIILDAYKSTVEDAYDKEYDEETGEEANQDTSPLFSLKVVNTGN